jgi:hypothetical protein
MELRGLVKRLVVPSGVIVPRELAHEDLRARAITRDDLSDDVNGINASLDLIRRTRGGRWPTEPVTEDFNYVDLVWHECEFRDDKSFTYVLRDADGAYLGCLYLYPMGGRTPLSEEMLAYDVDVSWWVTPPAYEAGWYPKVYAALQSWFADEIPFSAPYYSNAEIPS